MPVLKTTEKAAYDNAVTTLQAEMLRTKGISHTPADAANPDINLKKEHISVATPIIMEGDQTIPSDLDVAKTSRELITVGSFAKNIQTLADKTMMSRGIISDMNDITKPGMYSGANITGAPSNKQISIIASEDNVGNTTYLLLDDEGKLHTGIKLKNETNITWYGLASGSISEGVIEVKPENSGGFPTAILSTFTGQATHNLTDGNEHAVSFVLNGDWNDATDNRIWYLKEPSELGNIDGASGTISVTTMKQWIANGNIVTLKYDATNKKFHVVKVEGNIGVIHSTPILADGSVSMDATYTPTKDNDIITKKYYEDNFKPQHLSGTDDPADTLGNDGDIYLKLG